MQVTAYTTKIFREGQDLFNFVVQYLPKELPEQSIVAITSKIVALAENRTVEIPPNLSDDDFAKFKENLIKSESQFAMRTKYVWLTIKDGLVMASAGIDESNADGKIILLPKDSFVSADEMRKKLMAHYGVKELGVIITDSRLFPLRNGTVGVAMGYAGVKGMLDYRGKKDMFGRELKFARADVADALATAVVLEMGEGDECRPLSLITETVGVEFVDEIDRSELLIDPKEDLYQPLFEQLGKE